MNATDTIFEIVLEANKQDSQGREIVCVMGLRHDDTKFCAWVLESRLVGDNWLDHGFSRQAKLFNDQNAAEEWAYNTAVAMAAAI